MHEKRMNDVGDRTDDTQAEDGRAARESGPGDVCKTGGCTYAIRCRKCKRVLTDPQSIRSGYGPSCLRYIEVFRRAQQELFPGARIY